MCAKMMYGCSLKGMRATFSETLCEIGKVNEKMVVIDCETGTATNILDFRNGFPDRFITMGVAEQSGISFAFGVSRSGFIPIVPLFASFLTRRACDQIFIQIGYADANVKLIGCYAGLTSPNTGATHQSINDLAIMRSMPNVIIIETADPIELRQALLKIAEIKGPVYLRMIRGDIGKYDVNVNSPDYDFEIGKATVLKQGSDVSLVACGLMVPRCIDAANILSERGISAEVINCSTIKPIDTQTIVSSARKTGCVVCAENHSVMGGMGSAVVEMLAQEFPVPVKLVGIEDKYGESGELCDLFEKYGLTAEAIVTAAENVINRKR